MFEEVSEKAIVGTLILLGWEILAIGTIVNIVMKSRSAASAWGWSMAVLALPFITVPLYWIFGRYQFKGYLERLREARDKHEEAYRDHVAMMTPHYALLEGDEARYGGVLEKITERRFTRGNEVCLLIDGDQTFGSIFAAIEAAQSYVLVQFFIVHDDDLDVLVGLGEHALDGAAQGVRTVERRDHDRDERTGVDGSHRSAQMQRRCRGWRA